MNKKINVLLCAKIDISQRPTRPIHHCLGQPWEGIEGLILHTISCWFSLHKVSFSEQRNNRCCPLFLVPKSESCSWRSTCKLNKRLSCCWVCDRGGAYNTEGSPATLLRAEKRWGWTRQPLLPKQGLLLFLSALPPATESWERLSKMTAIRPLTWKWKTNLYRIRS